MELDFVRVKMSAKSKDVIISPEFNPKKISDLMVKGKEFYAFYDSRSGLWSHDESELFEIIDNMVMNYAPEQKDAKRMLIGNYSSGMLTQWRRFCRDIGSRMVPLDSTVIFADTETKREDYASIKLPYSMKDVPCPAYNELMRTLYNASERKKIEWAIGSVINGDSKTIQKFYVFYGSAGSGKSTVMKIIEMLLPGYTKSFNAKDLGDGSKQFSLAPLSSNPLVGIDPDGDLSRVNDNTLLNSIVGHDMVVVNEKQIKQYQMSFNTTLFIGSNKPVKITDAKSGLMRRLIDISPSGHLVSFDRYQQLMTQIPFELSGIAHHCLDIYNKFGKDYYNNYKPTKMIDETNDMYNFVQDMTFFEWKDCETVSLANAWKSYKDWVTDSGVQYPLIKRVFKVELKEYFDDFIEREGNACNVYVGLKKDKFKFAGERKAKTSTTWLTMSEGIHSQLDDILEGCKAQYASDDGHPRKNWSNIRTKLFDIVTSRLHFVQPQNKFKNLIVIDFDIKNDKGEKDALLNLEAASKWPQTYAELSKSGQGIHLHYFYDGDVETLDKNYADKIEVLKFTGDSALRRKLTKCNDIPIATISSGLPLKEKKGESMISDKRIQDEEHLVAFIRKCLKKEHHGHTKPEVDFIAKVLNDTYADESVSYDIRELRPKIVSFATSSTNQSQQCFDIVSKLHYCSKDFEQENEPLTTPGTSEWNEAPIVFYDVEVFPNLFIVCWKKLGEENKVVRMINPSPNDVKKLFSFRLVGFNNRRYDNHIIYARSMGYSNAESYKLSQKIISGNRSAMFGSAYGLSYTDIWDYCSNPNKMSLKKWEIKLGIFHLENAHPWDQPVDEEFWEEIADYCENDIIATEAVWNATQADFRARLILSELSGLTPNDTTNSHTQQIIFGDDKNPQREFNLPDLSKEFPGYEFKQNPDTKKWESWYMGEKVGEGGWVFSKPGMYFNGICEDVSGMHPSTIKALNLFGDIYTKRYYDLVLARTYIKHGEYDKLESMFDGKLMKYITTDEDAKALSNALKTAVNAVYGMTFSKYNFRCTVPNNRENVVAKRGALFMIKLKNEVEKKGYEVIHCKTDSIKLANPDNDILDFIVDYGKQYGYNFEVEDVFERICLVNDSTFIAKTEAGNWFAKAAQFQHPYVFKDLFTKETIAFEDLCETKNVTKGAMYLDMNERLGEDEHDYHFVGRVGQFTPVLEGTNGGRLVKSEDQVKYDAVVGTKDRRWLESETIKNLGLEDRIDYGYFDDLRDKAHAAVSKYGDFDIFVNADPKMFRDYIETRDSDYEVVPF